MGVAAVWAAYLLGWGEYTNCYAHFDSPEAAERAASVARAAGFGADVEEDEMDSRRPTSPGGRGVSVTFSDGETGDDARKFRAVFHELVDQEGGQLGHDPGNGCLERPLWD